MYASIHVVRAQRHIHTGENVVDPQHKVTSGSVIAGDRLLDLRTDSIEVAGAMRQDHSLEVATNVSARLIIHVIGITGIRHPDIGISTTSRPRRLFHHACNRIRNISHLDLFPDRFLRAEQFAGQRIRDHGTGQARTEISLRKGLAGEEVEVEDFPESGIGIADHILFEPPVRQGNDRPVFCHSSHRLGCLKGIKTFLHYTVRHGCGITVVRIGLRISPYAEDIKHPVTVRLRPEAYQPDLELKHNHQYHCDRESRS